MFNIIGYDSVIKRTAINNIQDKKLVEYLCGEVKVEMRADGKNSIEDIKLTVTGDLGREVLTFKDTYQSFSKMLIRFIQCVEKEEVMTCKAEMLAVANMIGLGLD